MIRLAGGDFVITKAKKKFIGNRKVTPYLVFVGGYWRRVYKTRTEGMGAVKVNLDDHQVATFYVNISQVRDLYLGKLKSKNP